MQRFILYSILSLVLLLLHFLIVPYIQLARVTPDLLLIFVIFLSVREGQVAGTVAGFALGLLLDLVGGETSVLGLSALAKSVSGFVAGYFYSEGRSVPILGSYRFLLIVGGGSLLHNLIYFTVYLQGTAVGFADAVFLHAIPGALYCMVIGTLPMFFFSRQHSAV